MQIQQLTSRRARLAHILDLFVEDSLRMFMRVNSNAPTRCAPTWPGRGTLRRAVTPTVDWVNGSQFSLNQIVLEAG